MEPEVTQELIDACNYMIDITGGSKHWDGETHVALKKIEKAVFRANKMMSIIGATIPIEIGCNIQPCPICGAPMSFANNHYFCRDCEYDSERQGIE